ncbi:MAG: amidohydrolase family protein [Fibrobacter sp.]|nr:amidohydrolase family protein [Fibrobacter sp.]
MDNVILKNVRAFVNGQFETVDSLAIVNGIWQDSAPEGTPVVDGNGALALPALFALGIDFQEPKRDDIYTYRSGFRAMRRGGFYGGLYESSANPVDGIQRLVAEKAALGYHGFDIQVLGAINQDYEAKALAEMCELADGGVAGFGDGNKAFGSMRFLRLCLEYGAMTQKRFFFLPYDYSLAHGGYVNEGNFSDMIGMKGIPEQAETIPLFSLLEMARWLGVPLHIKQVTSKSALDLIRRFREMGVNVTCDVDIHHLLFCDEDVASLNTSLNLHPPVRSASDKDALWEALADGTIQAVSINHFPVHREDKEVNFEDAVPGAISLEIALPALWNKLAERLGDKRAIEVLSSKPAEIAGAEVVNLGPGKKASLVLFDPNGTTDVTSKTFAGGVENSPFLGKTLSGKILGSYIAGMWG